MVFRTGGGSGNSGGSASLTTPLTGLNTAQSPRPIVATDSILGAFGLLQAEINAGVPVGSLQATSFNVVPVSTARGVVASIPMPAGYPKPTSYVEVSATWTKSGTVDTVVPAIAFSPVGSGTVLGNASQMATVAQQETAVFRIWGNGVDNTSVIWSRGAQNTPFTNVQASQNDATVALNTAAAWTLNMIVTTAANETVTGTRFFVNLNPVVGQSSAPTIAAPVTSSAGRAMTAADSGVTVLDTGATADTYTVPTGLGFPMELEICKFAAGNPSFLAASGVTINGVNAGTAGPVTVQYSSVVLQATSADNYRVIS